MLPILYQFTSLRYRFGSLRALGKYLGISASTLSRYANGSQSRVAESKISAAFRRFYTPGSIVQWRIKVRYEKTGEVGYRNGVYFRYTSSAYAEKKLDELLDKIFSRYDDEAFEILEANLEKKSVQKGKIRHIRS